MTDVDGKQLFLDHYGSIERAVRLACHRWSLRGDEAEEFASYVNLKLIENDHAILRKHNPNGSFPAFIGVVVNRMLLDYRIAMWGKWHASAEAKRLGERGITIEAMVIRDGRTIDEIMPMLTRRWKDLTRRQVEEIVRSLPQRIPRGRAVDLEFAANEIGADTTTVEDAAFTSDRAIRERKTGTIVRAVMNELEERDRLICKLHYQGGLSVADIARTLRLEPKPLYRRLQRLLAFFRTRLESQGIGADTARELLSSLGTNLDFGFEGGTTGSRPSNDQEDA